MSILVYHESLREILIGEQGIAYFHVIYNVSCLILHMISTMVSLNFGLHLSIDILVLYLQLSLSLSFKPVKIIHRALEWLMEYTHLILRTRLQLIATQYPLLLLT